MTRKPKADDVPPLYEVDELPVERRLFTRGRRTQSGPLVIERDGKKVVVERRNSPGRRKTDRESGPDKA
jgi:hypothetical protein